MSQFEELNPRYDDPDDYEYEDHLFYRDKTDKEKSDALEDLSNRINVLIDKVDRFGQILIKFSLEDINDMIKVASGFCECLEKEEEKVIGNKFLQLLNMIKEQMENISDA